LYCFVAFSREKHKIRSMCVCVCTHNIRKKIIIFYLPTYFNACVCVVPPAGRKLVSIMSSDRRDGNIRDERNIELDEKRGVVVSYGSGRLVLSSRRSRSIDGGASNSPCFLDIKYIIIPSVALKGATTIFYFRLFLFSIYFRVILGTSNRPVKSETVGVCVDARAPRICTAICTAMIIYYLMILLIIALGKGRGDTSMYFSANNRSIRRAFYRCRKTF